MWEDSRTIHSFAYHTLVTTANIIIHSVIINVFSLVEWARRWEK